MFTEEVASRALQECHNEIFQDLARASIQELLREVELYISLGCVETDRFIRFWQEFEPYRVAIPLTSDSVSAQLFNSNVKIVLAILRHRANDPRNSSQAALPRP